MACKRALATVRDMAVRPAFAPRRPSSVVLAAPCAGPPTSCDAWRRPWAWGECCTRRPCTSSAWPGAAHACPERAPPGLPPCRPLRCPSTEARPALPPLPRGRPTAQPRSPTLTPGRRRLQVLDLLDAHAVALCGDAPQDLVRAVYEAVRDKLPSSLFNDGPEGGARVQLAALRTLTSLLVQLEMQQRDARLVKVGRAGAGAGAQLGGPAAATTALLRVHCMPPYLKSFGARLLSIVA